MPVLNKLIVVVLGAVLFVGGIHYGFVYEVIKTKKEVHAAMEMDMSKHTMSDFDNRIKADFAHMRLLSSVCVFAFSCTPKQSSDALALMDTLDKQLVLVDKYSAIKEQLVVKIKANGQGSLTQAEIETYQNAKWNVFEVAATYVDQYQKSDLPSYFKALFSELY